MAETPDDLTVKHILETYFRVEDLQKVLKAFNLPFIGRKPELFQRVLSLINHRQYELDFISKVKKKVVQTLKLRVGPEVKHIMAPTVTTTDTALQKKPKQRIRSKRYESDDSYSQTSEEEVSEEEDDSEFIASQSSTDSDKQMEESTEVKKSKKRKRVIDPKSSSSDSSTDSSSSDDSSDDSSKVLNKYLKKSRNERRIEKLLKRKLRKANKLKLKNGENRRKPKIRKTYQSSDSDSKICRNRRKNRKTPINIDLSSSDNELEGNANHKSNSEDNGSGRSSDEKEIESDDEIQFLEFVPASESTIVRTNHFRTKESSSSDTESSAENPMSGSEMDLEITDLEITRNGLQNELQRLVTNESNSIRCDTSATNAPEVQTQEIDSQNLNQTIAENSDQMDVNLNELTVLSNNSVESNALIDNALEIISNQVNTVSNTSNPKPIETTPIVETKQLVVVAKARAPVPVPVPEPPQPQLPITSPEIMIIKTPKKDAAKRQFVIQNGVQKVIEPAPKLRDFFHVPVINSSLTIKKIQKRLNVSTDEFDIIDQDLKVSLLCPISNLRVKIPSRSNQCHHIDCFDINNFIEINFYKRIEDWKCPKCKQSAKDDQLIIDSLIKHILSTTDSSVESVIFDKKAIWTPDVKRVDNCINHNNSNNVINIDQSLEEDVIELESDDEPSPSEPSVLSMPTSYDINSKLNQYAAQIASAKTVELNVSNVLQNNRQQTGEQEVLQTTHTPTTSAHQILLNIGQQPQRNTSNQNQLPNATQQPNRQFIPLRPSITINRAPNPNLNPTPSSNTTQRVNLSGDIKFEFNSTGICAIYCKICNENLKISNNSEALIKSHVNSVKHKCLLAQSKGISTNSVQNNNQQNNRPNVSQNNRQIVTQNNRQIDVLANRTQNSNLRQTSVGSVTGNPVLQSSTTTYTRYAAHNTNNNYTYPAFNTNTNLHYNQYVWPQPQPPYPTQSNQLFSQTIANFANQAYQIRTAPPPLPLPPPPAHSHPQYSSGPPPAHSSSVNQFANQIQSHLTPNQYTANSNLNSYSYNSYS